MPENMSLHEFLKILATATGDEAIEIIGDFQCGGLIIENIAVEDVE